VADGRPDGLDEQIEAERRVALGLVRRIVADLGYSAHIIERAPEVPYDTLLVDLPPTAAGEVAYQLALTFYPMDAEEFGHTSFLQYYIALPVMPTAATRSALLELSAEINNQLVLGHLGLTGGGAPLHFRYVQALSADEPPAARTIGDVLVFVAYSLRLFDPALQAVANGSVDLDGARSMIAAARG
jgi:hypothetical protein